ncbi:glycosyltransferase family 39 protein [Candidatus Woesebacteria bacterium]|nr:glycosyltransferase family 39 protein [Candidatus Woesebacteria bacterium]
MLPAETVFNQSIWGDEGFSAILSMKSLPQIIKIIATDTSPPLWNITEWIVFNTLGTDEVYIRGLSFLYFILTVFFVYKIGTLFYSKKTGFIVALLTFLNPFFFMYAFEGRMYSIMALGVTASMYFFLKIYYRPKEISLLTKIGYVFFTLWALYSHHFAFFAVFVQGLWWIKEMLFGKRITSKKVFKLFLITAIGYLPWLIPLYNQTKMVGGGFWLGTPDADALTNLISEYLALGNRSLSYTIPLLGVKFYDIVLYLVITTLAIRKWHRQIEKNIFLLLWFLGPILITYGVSQFFQSIFYNRYLLYTIPGAMIILGSGRRKYISTIPLFLTIVSFFVIDLHYFTHPKKLPFRQLGEYVSQTRQEGDITINWNSSAHHLWETKYYGFDSPIYIPEGGDLPYFVGTALMEERDILRSIPSNAKRVGVTTSGPIEEIELPGYTEIKTARWEEKGLKFLWLEKE